MTIDQAIEILKMDQRRNYTEKEGNIYKAQELGIEALKELGKLRNSGILGAWKPLPGETKEHS